MVRKAAGYGSVLLCVYPDIDTLRECDGYVEDESSRDEDVLMFADDDPLDLRGEGQPPRIHNEDDVCHQHLAEEMNLDTDADWTEILDNQPIVLNDRMMTDAMPSPRIQSEHSYSLTLNDEMPQSPFGLAHNIKLEDYSKEMETDCFPVVSITSTGQSDFPLEDIVIKQEPPSPPPRIPSPSPSRSTATTISALLGAPSSPLHPQSLLKQPTIVLASRNQQQQIPPSGLSASMGITTRDLLYPKVKHEPTLSTSGFPFPPTPPSCNGSDSDGSLSPVHSLRRPISPIISYAGPSSSSSSSGGAGSSRKGHAKVMLSANSTKQANSNQTSLISSQPKGATGVLVLTEEEKRTLLAEGYPIPQRLPLTKAEERSLKKIRRKIKNKISAQESRRKKKEYMDALEKKVEILASENSDFKKKVDSLEGSNNSLLSQLQQMQAILESQISHKRSRSVATQTFPSATAMRQSEFGRSSKTAEFIDLPDAKLR